MARTAAIQSLPRPPRRGRKGRAVARRHPAARAHSRRHRARAGGRRGLRTRRAHPPGLDPLPSRQRERRAARARGDLDSLDNDQTLAIVRAFSYFSHLANIAEDQHHIRRNRAHAIAGSAPRPGSLRLLLSTHPRDRASSRNARATSSTSALVSPVLTAHPTEVRRKSTLTRELRSPTLLDERERARGDEAELARNEERLRRAVLSSGAPTCCARRGSRSSTRFPTASPITTTRSSASCRASMARSRTSSTRQSPAAREARRPFLRDRLVDRRRPRRQSVRHRRSAQRSDAAAKRARAAALSRRAARARRRIVDEPRPHARQPRARSARRAARPTTRAARRTSPIAAPSPASIRASPRPRASSTMSRAAPADRRGAAPIATPPNSPPISQSSPSRSRPTAAPSSRAGG